MEDLIGLMSALREAASELDRQIASGRFTGVILHCNDRKVTVSPYIGFDTAGEDRGDTWCMIDEREKAVELIEATKDDSTLRAWAEERELQRWNVDW